jgi:hypothetical protein
MASNVGFFGQFPRFGRCKPLIFQSGSHTVAEKGHVVPTTLLRLEATWFDDAAARLIGRGGFDGVFTAQAATKRQRNV